MSVRKKREKVSPRWYQKAAVAVSRQLIKIYAGAKYGFHAKPVKFDEPVLIMSNHTTDFDQFYPLASIKGHMYFVCSEHLFRTKTAKLMTMFGDPIYVFKGSVALSSTLEILKRLRDGNTVCIFPEGSRSFDGKTGPIAESTGKLVQKGKCGLVTFRTEGGYFIAPRWAKYQRKGKISGGIVHYYPSSEIAKMKVDEINRHINEDLFVDAYAAQKKHPVKYPGENLAEGIENFLFICPKCGGFETIRSAGNAFRCEKCGMTGQIDEYGMMSGENFPFTTVPEWEDFENEAFDRMYEENENLTFTNEDVRLTVISEDHVETELGTGTLTGDKNGFSICGHRFDFISMQATEYINLGNTFMFTYNDGKHYTMTTGYLNGVKYRKMYFKRMEKEAALTGRKVDLAK